MTNLLTSNLGKILRASMLTIVLFLSLYLNLYATAAHGSTQTALTEKDAREHVIEKYGPLVSPSQVPFIYRELNRVAEKFSEIQAERLQAHVVSTSELFIIHSNLVNAFVVVVRPPGHTKSKNMVFMTTELLRQFLAVNPNYSFKESMNHLIGIIAHEFGHPIDKVDGVNSIEDHYGRSGSQAVELRADHEGDVLLEKAGYPPDALHEALRRMSIHFRKNPGALMSGISTHPDDELRLSAQRTRLTGSRLLFGQSQNPMTDYGPGDETRALTELKNLVEPTDKIRYRAPENAMEAAQRLAQLLRETSEDLNRAQKIEVNALTLWLDQFLETQGKSRNQITGVSDDLPIRQLFAQALLSSTRDSTDPLKMASQVAKALIPTRRGVEITLTKHVDSHGIRDFRPHAVRLESLEILPAEGLRELLQAELLSLHNEYQKLTALGRSVRNNDFDDFLRGLGNWATRGLLIAPIEIIYEVWVKNPMNYELIRHPKFNLLDMEKMRFHEAGAIFRALSVETHSHSLNGLRAATLFSPIQKRARARLFELKQWKTRSDLSAALSKNGLYAVISSFISSFDNVALRINPNGTDEPNGLARYVSAEDAQTTRPRPWFDQVQKFAKEYYGYVWEHRGAFGFNELTARLQTIDWKKIRHFAAPALPLDVVHSAIRKSVITYVRSIDQTSVETSALSRYLTPEKSMPQLDHSEAKRLQVRPDWYSVEVERAFKARPDVAPPGAPKSPLTELASVPTPYQKMIRAFDTFMEKHFRSSTFVKNPEKFRTQFLSALEEAAAFVRKTKSEADWTYAEFEEINVRAFQSAFKMNLLETHDVMLANNTFEKVQKRFFEAHISLIEKLALTPENRAVVLRKIFLDLSDSRDIENSKFQKDNVNPSLFMHQTSSGHVWLIDVQDAALKSLPTRVYNEFKRAGTVKDLPEFFKLIENSVERKNGYSGQLYSDALNGFKTVFEIEINEAVKTQNDAELLKTFARYSRLLHGFKQKEAWNGKQQNSVTNTDVFSHLLLKIWDKANWNPRDRYQAFILLTNHWVSPKTDELFERMVRPLLKESEVDITVQRLLSQNRIYSETLRIELATKQFQLSVQQQQEQSRDKSLSHNELFKSFELFERMVPSDSSERDQALEKFGWQLELVGQKLNAFVENAKSTNWAKQDPKMIAVASAVSNLLSGLSVSDKIRLLDIIVEYKKNSGLPTWLIQRLYASVLRDLRFKNQNVKNESQRLSEDDLRKAADETTYKTRETTQRLLDATTPLQRLPLIEIILGSKNFELMSLPNTFDVILDRHLKFDSKSDDRLHLESYLAVIPSHERAVTLAYLLAQSQDRTQNKEGSLKAVLEAFPPVGIKLGQKGRIFGIFGPQFEKELSELKDNARPMSRYEIETQIQKSLDATEKKIKIRILEIKGSASIGVVVIADIEVPGEKPVRAALKVQRPHLAKQIATNMDLGRRYISEVARRKGEKPSPLFMALVDAMEAQFSTEIDFREEAKSTHLAQDLVRSLRSNLRSENFAGWNVDVPNVLDVIKPKPDLVAFQAVDGETLKSAFEKGNLSLSDRKALGELATQVSLMMFFKYGVFDPDRHVGNWMIDRKTKTIYMIDVGQLTRYRKISNPFSSDDRMALANFLHSYKTKNIDMMIEAIGQMSLEKNMIPQLRSKTHAALLNWSKGNEDLSQSIRDLVQLIYDLGHKMRPDFTFGALNGLLTLAGENYVSSERFNQIIEGEVRSLKMKKAPVTAKEMISGRFSGLFSGQLDGLGSAIEKGPSQQRTCEAMFQPARR